MATGFKQTGNNGLNVPNYSTPIQYASNLTPDTSIYSLSNPYASMQGYGAGGTNILGKGLDNLTPGAGGSGNAFGFSTPMFGPEGWGGTALSGLQGLASAYLGKQQLDLAKQSLAQNKLAFTKNFNTQAGLTNASLEDRQRARVASNAGAYQSVGEYMDKNKVGTV